MGMAISSVSSLVSSGIGASPAQSESTQRNPVAQPQRNEVSSTTQLSAFGRTKSSLEGIKASAQAINNLSNPPTFSDLKVAVQGFVQSINALASTVKQAALDASEKSAADVDTRPSQALTEINKAFTGEGGSSLAALQKLGISENEGTFSINQRQLETSFQENRQDSLSELNKVADRVEDAADKQLTGAPPIERKSNAEAPAASQSDDARNEEQARVAQRESSRELLTAQLANAGGFVARNAVLTYFSVAAL